MVAGGDITITIIPDIIPVEDTGVGDIGHVIRIRTVVLREQAVIEILLLRFAGPVRLPVQVCHPIEETDKAVRPPDVW